MFNTKKFGGYLSRLRKNADMTQSELADQLNLTRQAISKYETGDSFPDISILVLIADIYHVSLDELINSGEPSRNESVILNKIASGNMDVEVENIADMVNLAPLVKPGVLAKMAKGFSKQGIDISNVVNLAEYLNDEGFADLLEKASFECADPKLIEKLIPFLDEKSKLQIFQKILDGETDWHMIKVILPYAEYLSVHIEAAVIEGALPWEALDVLREGRQIIHERKVRDDEL